jgi:hypothetical protein
MKKLTLATLVAVVTTAAPGLTGVAGAYTTPTGPLCSLAAGPDPLSEPGGMVGVVEGGPLTAIGTTMTMGCAVQVGSNVHADPDSATVTAGPAADSVTVEPAAVTYVSAGLPTFLCTWVHQVDQTGETDLYWDHASQSWTQSALTATCPPVPAAAAAVEGGIVVEHPVSGPVEVIPMGVLANPLLWTCTVPAYSPAAPFVVTCTPVSSAVPWSCAFVIAAATTGTPTATVRTAVDCDGSAPDEVRTRTVTGAGDNAGDFDVSGVAATTFTCRLDDGGTGGPVPGYVAYCLDPGAGEPR